MAGIKVTNNAVSQLAGAINAVVTTLVVASSDGALFPSLGAGEWFMATLTKLVAGVPVREIVKVTARTLDTFTIVRGQEGTIATTFSGGDIIELRITAGSFDETAKKSSDNAFTGSNTHSGTETFSNKLTMSGAVIDEAKGADIASAGTINLTTATGNVVHITGTTTITAITIPSGAERTIIFDGILTLTNGANLILPSGANIVTAAGDCAVVRGDGTAARVTEYTRANGQPVASSAGNSEVVVHTDNGFGSTNNKIRRFTTTLTNVGSAITYADSATAGASFTINETGLYSIHYSDFINTSTILFGASLNSANLTTSVASIPIAERLMMGMFSSPQIAPVSRVVRLSAGDVIRAHTDGASPNGTPGDKCFFAIRKVS